MTQDEIPSWLVEGNDDRTTPPSLSDFIDRQRESERAQLRQRLSEIEPSVELLEKIKQAGILLMEKIAAVSPDVVLFSGRSSAFSEAVFKMVLTELHDARQGHISSQITELFYGLADGEDLRTEALQQLEREAPMIQAEHCLVVLDDYTATGSKAEKFLAAFKALGYANTYFAVYSSYADREYPPRVIVGLVDDELTTYISQLAMMISIGGRTFESTSVHAEMQPEIQRKTREVLQQIVTYLDKE